MRNTPGPWVAQFHHEHRDGGRFYVHVTADGLVPVAGVPAGVEGYGREEGRANAKLIAAAPDLLQSAKLLESLCAWLLHAYGPESPPGVEAECRLKQVRAAISKATAQE